MIVHQPPEDRPFPVIRSHWSNRFTVEAVRTTCAGAGQPQDHQHLTATSFSVHATREGPGTVSPIVF